MLYFFDNEGGYVLAFVLPFDKKLFIFFVNRCL